MEIRSYLLTNKQNNLKKKKYLFIIEALKINLRKIVYCKYGLHKGLQLVKPILQNLRVKRKDARSFLPGRNLLKHLVNKNYQVKNGRCP